MGLRLRVISVAWRSRVQGVSRSLLLLHNLTPQWVDYLSCSVGRFFPSPGHFLFSSAGR